jgi:hypothetical protein
MSAPMNEYQIDTDTAPAPLTFGEQREIVRLLRWNERLAAHESPSSGRAELYRRAAELIEAMEPVSSPSRRRGA